MKHAFDFLKNALSAESTRPPLVTRARRLLVYPLIFTGVFILVFSFQVLLSDNSATGSLAEEIKHFSFLNVLGLSDERPLAGESNDRVNVLLLGMGGIGHQGPFLTDTMLLASFQPSTKRVAMISIPRDMSVPIPGNGWKKINSINHYGEMEKPGSGAEYTRRVLSEVLDLPIQYVVRVDFSGFIDLVNELGGLDVYVERSFVDSTFPTDDFGTTTVDFEKGWVKMDGETALEFARSRHGNNGEGSDFARSQRQQKVMKALKSKVLSASTFLSPKKIGALLSAYKKNITTNVQRWELARFASLARDIKDEHIATYFIDDGDDGLLYASIINDAYLLLPKDHTFAELQTIIGSIFEQPAGRLTHATATVEVRNGTDIEGLASRTAEALQKRGLSITLIGNAEQRDQSETVIYDFSKGTKERFLAEITKALPRAVTRSVEQWIGDDENTTVPYSSADFLIILGKDESLTTSYGQP